MQIYVQAKEQAGYTATRFHQMLTTHRGVETARRLLPQMSDGFTELWRRNRLDLTVEALVVQSKWDELFSDEERQIRAQSSARLRDGCLTVWTSSLHRIASLVSRSRPPPSSRRASMIPV